MDVLDVNTVLRVKRVGDGIIGFEIDLPNAPPLIVVRGRRGFIMCGYLDLGVADKLGLVAVRVSGVSSVEDMLDKEVSGVSSKARELGIKVGDKVKDIIDLV